MGSCIQLPSKNILTQTENLSTQSAMIKFKIHREQPFPQKIKAIILIIVEPNVYLRRNFNQMHAERQIKLDVAEICSEFNVKLPRNTTIQFRLAYQYKDFLCKATDVKTMIYNPGNRIESQMRVSLSNISKQKEKLIEFVRRYKNENISYFETDKAIINILLLGYKGTGKSSYIGQISRIINNNNQHSPMKGHHAFFSTTKSYRKYQLIQNSNIKLNIIDSPGNEEVFVQLPNLLNGKLKGNSQDYEEVIHSSIIFVDTTNKNSVIYAEEAIKILLLSSIQYTIVLTHWDNDFPIYQKLFIQNKHNQLINILRVHHLQPILSRTFFISNIKAEQGNLYAQYMNLQVLKQTISLVSNFYINNPPIYIILDGKLLDIKHKIGMDQSLDQFIAQIQLDKLINEYNPGLNIKKLFIEGTFGPKLNKQKGVILYEKQLERANTNMIQDYLSIQDKKHRKFKLYTKAPFFSKLIK